MWSSAVVTSGHSPATASWLLGFGAARVTGYWDLRIKIACESDDCATAPRGSSAWPLALSSRVVVAQRAWRHLLPVFEHPIFRPVGYGVPLMTVRAIEAHPPKTQHHKVTLVAYTVKGPNTERHHRLVLRKIGIANGPVASRGPTTWTQPSPRTCTRGAIRPARALRARAHRATKELR